MRQKLITQRILYSKSYKHDTNKKQIFTKKIGYFYKNTKNTNVTN